MCVRAHGSACSRSNPIGVPSTSHDAVGAVLDALERRVDLLEQLLLVLLDREIALAQEGHRALVGEVRLEPVLVRLLRHRLAELRLQRVDVEEDAAALASQLARRSSSSCVDVRDMVLLSVESAASPRDRAPCLVRHAVTFPHRRRSCKVDVPGFVAGSCAGRARRGRTLGGVSKNASAVSLVAMDRRREARARSSANAIRCVAVGTSSASSATRSACVARSVDCTACASDSSATSAARSAARAARSARSDMLSLPRSSVASGCAWTIARNVPVLSDDELLGVVEVADDRPGERAQALAGLLLGAVQIAQHHLEALLVLVRHVHDVPCLLTSLAHQQIALAPSLLVRLLGRVLGEQQRVLELVLELLEAGQSLLEALVLLAGVAALLPQLAERAVHLLEEVVDVTALVSEGRARELAALHLEGRQGHRTVLPGRVQLRL